MNVTKTKDEGKYFYAHDDELTAVFGYDDWNRQVTEVVKVGLYETNIFWKIMVWKLSDGSHGRRDPFDDVSDYDWSAGDIFISKKCALGNNYN